MAPDLINGVTLFFFSDFIDIMVTIKVRGLKLLFLLTFVVAVVTPIRNMEYVIVSSNRHYKSVSFTLNRMNVRHDTGTCAVAMAFTNESHSADSQDCKVPTLDPFHPGVMKNIRRVESITCKEIQYTEYEKNVLRLRDDVSDGLRLKLNTFQDLS